MFNTERSYIERSINSISGSEMCAPSSSSLSNPENYKLQLQKAIEWMGPNWCLHKSKESKNV